MVDFASPGVKVREKRQEPFASITGATTFGAMMGKAERGPVNTPIAVTSLDDFREVFGGNLSDSFLADSAQHFFDNGGRVLWVNRVAHYTDITNENTLTAIAAETMLDTTAVPALAGQLISDNGAFPATLADGDTFGPANVDAGGVGTLTIQAVAATVTGAGGTFAAGTPGDTLTFTFEGTQYVIDLSAVGAGIANYVALINAQAGINFAGDDGGQLSLTSSIEGSSSIGTVDAFGGAAAAKTGLAAGAVPNAGPNNVANVAAVTATELAGLFDATFAGSTSTPDDTLGQMTWASNTTGPTSSVQLTAGTGVAKIAGFDNVIHAGSAAVVAQDTLNAAASSPGSFGNAERVAVTHTNTVAAKVQAATAAGATTTLLLSSVSRIIVGDTLSITEGDDTQRGVVTAIDSGLRQVTFENAITVPAGGYTTSTDVVQESFTLQHVDADGVVTFTFAGLRMSPLAERLYVETVVNGTSRSPLEVTDQALVASGTLDPRPAETVSIYLGLDTLGADGGTLQDIDFIGDSSAKTGFRAYDDFNDFILLSTPGETAVAVQLGLESYAELRQDFFAVQEVPQGLNPQDAITHVTQTANLASSYEAIYYPWIQAVDVRTGLSESFPPSGFVQGVIARTHQTRNFGKAPAGITDGRVNGATGVDFEVKQSSYDLLYPKNINAIQRFEGAGISVFGSRTLDPIGDFRQISVRFVFLFVRRDFEVRTRFATFENNTPTTRGRVTRTTRSALRELREAEILEGENDDEAFFVVCDETNNTALVRKQGKLKCRVGMAVANPSEFIEITLEQDTRAIDAELAAS